jgi:hypothetical protein
MSDVSGIPYMGPMGQGNFFAPQFSYNPQMTAGQISSSYMPEIQNNQNVVNNLWASGGGFGQLTNYYAQQVANSYGAINANYPRGLPPAGTFSDYNAGGAWPAGGSVPTYTTSGGAANAPTGTINNDAWRISPQGPDFMGGGGFSSGSLSGFPSPQQSSYTGPAIDWGNVGQAAANFGSGGGGLSPGMLSGLGGLGGAGYTPQPSSSLDWSTLFSGGGGGGARADPYPGMSMPGGLASPMTAQQPAYDYGSLFKGGDAQADPYPGMTMPGGLSSPMTAQQPAYDYGSLFGQGADGTGAKQSSVFDTGTAPVIGTQDTGPYGGGAGIGGLDTGRAIGEPYTAPAEPNQYPMLGTPVTEAYNPYSGVTGGEGAGPPTDTRTSGALAPGGGLTATDLGAQARAKLAELMSGPKEPSPDEVFAGDKPVPTEGRPGLPDELPGEAGRGGMVGRPAATPDPATDIYPGANPPRPPAEVPFTVERGKEASMRGVQPRLAAAVQGGAQFLPPGYSVEVYSGERFDSPGHKQAFHKGGRAMDVRIIGPDGPIPSEGADSTGMYTLLARGVKTWAAQNDPKLLQTGVGGLGYGGAFETKAGSGVPDLMHHDLGGSRGNLRPEVRSGELPLLTEAEKNAMPANIPLLGANQVPLDVPNARSSGEATAHAAPPLPAQGPATQTYPGAEAPRPPVDIPDPRVSGAGFNALDAAAPPSGVEKAQTFLNRPLESILRQYSPENLSAAGFVLDLKQPMREALKGPFGGQILSGLQPKLGSLGLTQSDFTKAVADPRARFGGDFGGMAGELPSAGSFTPFEGFRQSADFENRTNEQLGRDQLAELQARGTNYEPGPEVAPTPLGSALGLEDIGRSSAFDPTTFQRQSGDPRDVTTSEEFTPTRSITERAPSPAAEEMQRRYGGVGNADVGPSQYSGFEQPYGSTLAPGAYTREQFENRADYTAQDQAERLAAGREMAGAQLAIDPAMERRLIDTIQAEVGRNASDPERAALVESLLNRQTFNRDFRTDARVNRPDAAGRDWTDLGRLGLLSTGEDSYYQPFRSYGGTVTPTIQAAHAEVERDPAYAAHLRELVSQVIYGGSNVSNLATGNASDIPGGQQMGTDARRTQAPGWYGPTPQETFAREIASSAARNWSQSLAPSGYTDPMSRAQRWQSIVANPYGGR